MARRVLSIAHFNREKQFTSALDVDLDEKGAFFSIRKADKTRSVISLNPAELGQLSATLAVASANLTAQRAEADFQAYKEKQGPRPTHGVMEEPEAEF